MRGLPDNHPVKQAIERTSLPPETRPLSDGVEILTPKERTQLQGIKRRQKGYSGQSKSEATKLLKEEVGRAWEKEFNLAKARQNYRPGNYFQTYE